MSFLHLIDSPSVDPGDHVPIIKMLERHDTDHGGWEEWASGCICGYYDKGSPGWFIPSRESAQRLYNRHVSLVLGLPVDPPELLEIGEQATIFTYLEEQ